ncbi:conserved hypothetical protein [Roseovarius sp. EC-HK134]|jgi:hypothetical protein|uniref:Oxalurate catabolism protein HpxZ n=1 Tax=Roseovarius mucosus TaxID=215743 RepID=A0A1V0RPA4_9RHOB|nr:MULTISPECIES: oxalurate catabolism protein HpxZ [Roseovarius]ARE83610.1 hypothetical protein ROSMUCSMR3_02137 [Roseovarius mucosus]AWZ19760.1 Hypothetical protein RAK1035_1049 [Roseovarius sp. AK1035]EDM30238.1 hypothetical protein RTM1035_18175 [Roseovarius sp. TM1035]MBW4973158.1 oxalurate catabolism protein HpxZ [Roseovarius mucosus]VVT09859.1 conserved hypothetical protein [Roseovarius sp. EC-HK134]|tara:strand:- start:601 stop:1002 length:402 start_codon:yes stop_codon:yes gene_type:complete
MTELSYINRPEVHAEVTEVFYRYETALVTNDVETLDALFWSSDHTIRLGASENLFGQDEILAFRKARPGVGLARSLLRVVVTTFGDDCATTNAIFTRAGWPASRTGRQSQTLIKLPEVGWQIVSAHVSIVDLE